MVRTIITPDQTDIHLSIPEDYVGKEIEVIFFALNESTPVKTKTLGDFAGLLPESDYLQLKEHTKQAREQWNRAF